MKERLKAFYNGREKVERKNCIISFLTGLVLIMMLPPTDAERISVNNFKRVIGLGLANDWDGSKVVGNFNQWFLLLPVFFFAFLFGLEYLLYRKPEIKRQSSYKMLDGSILSAVIVVFFRMASYFWKLTAFSFAYSFILGIFYLDVIYCYSGLERKLDTETYSFLKVLATAVSFPIAALYPGQWRNGKIWLLCFLTVFVFLSAAVVLLQTYYEKRKKTPRGGADTETIAFSYGAAVSDFFVFGNGQYPESV